jgi:dienelactone hydrolase
MGILVLVITGVASAAFAAYCISTQSGQREVKSYIRLGAFAAFILLALVSVIQWGFRWYGLAVLLFIWAALGAWALIGKGAERKEYSAGRIVRRAVGTMLLVLIAVLPALIFPQHRAPAVTGTHQVATALYTYTDESRTETFSTMGEKRKVNVEFWYPQDSGGPYPLVVFSHGAFGMKISNTSTFMELASNGYVVCSIDHPYHALFTMGADRRMVRVDPSFMAQIIGVNNGQYQEEEIFHLEQQWMALRTADINFVLDTILAHTKDAGADAVYQRIDPGKIGLMGHSLGGAATAQVARERKDIGAEINLDANLFGEYLDYVNGKYVLNDEPYPVPILIVYSDDMVRLMDAVKDPEAVAQIAVKHVAATARHAYEVHLAGTNHMSLTDLPLVSPLFVTIINRSVHTGGGHEADKYYIIEKMNSIVLEFFNVYLKGEGSFSSAGTY